MIAKETFARSTQSLSFTFDPKVTEKNIHVVLEKIFTAAGCRGCGLLGFDVHFHAVDPASRAQFQGVEGLLDVSNVGGIR